MCSNLLSQKSRGLTPGLIVKLVVNMRQGKSINDTSRMILILSENKNKAKLLKR